MNRPITQLEMKLLPKGFTKTNKFPNRKYRRQTVKETNCRTPKTKDGRNKSIVGKYFRYIQIIGKKPIIHYVNI